MGNGIDYSLEQYENDLPYNPELHGMNEEISNLKARVEGRVQRIIGQLKGMPKMRRVFEEMVEAASR